MEQILARRHLLPGFSLFREVAGKPQTWEHWQEEGYPSKKQHSGQPYRNMNLVQLQHIDRSRFKGSKTAGNKTDGSQNIGDHEARKYIPDGCISREGPNQCPEGC